MGNWTVDDPPKGAPKHHPGRKKPPKTKKIYLHPGIGDRKTRTQQPTTDLRQKPELDRTRGISQGCCAAEAISGGRCRHQGRGARPAGRHIILPTTRHCHFDYAVKERTPTHTHSHTHAHTEDAKDDGRGEPAVKGGPATTRSPATRSGRLHLCFVPKLRSPAPTEGAAPSAHPAVRPFLYNFRAAPPAGRANVPSLVVFRILRPGWPPTSHSSASGT